MVNYNINIGFVSTEYPPLKGGVAAYNKEIASSLVKCNVYVDVITRFRDLRPVDGLAPIWRDAESHRSTTMENGVQISTLGLSWYRRLFLRPCPGLVFRLGWYKGAQRLFNLAYAKALAKALPRVDIMHYSGRGVELLAHAALREARKREVPFVITPHTHPEEWGDSEIDCEIYRMADAVVALTQYEKNHLSSLGIPRDRIHVIPHGHALSGSGKASKVRKKWCQKNHLIGFLGRQTKEKGLGTLLEAMPEIWQVFPETTLLVAAPTWYDTDELLEEHQSVWSDERVKNLGFISMSEREDFLAGCDVICVPSRAEAYGLVYLEAAYYGTPVVARDLPALRELIGSYNGGLLVGEQDTVAEAVNQLLESRALRQHMGANARRATRGRTWAKAASRLTSLYYDVLGASCASSSSCARPPRHASVSPGLHKPVERPI